MRIRAQLVRFSRRLHKRFAADHRLYGDEEHIGNGVKTLYSAILKLNQKNSRNTVAFSFFNDRLGNILNNNEIIPKPK